MIRLGVNVDHVATVRQARRGFEPDPVAAANLAILGGADGITIHLREDRRHIHDNDVSRMRESIRCRLNLEMAVSEEIIQIALKNKPEEATLVPEKREELTTEGGLDIITHKDSVQKTVQRLKDSGIEVSLFIDPDFSQIDMAKSLGADAIELQTASYSEAVTPAMLADELEKLQVCTKHAHELGLNVHVGHGLNYHNVQAVAAIPHVLELNIGHSIISRAVLVGIKEAVREMKNIMLFCASK